MNTVVVVLAIAGMVHCRPNEKEDFGVVPDTLSGMLLPPFLKSVSGMARIEYFAIVMSMNETIAQQKQDILTWAQKHGIEAQVQEYNTNLTNIVKGIKQNVTEVITSLPSALQQYSSLIDNENQTPLELKKSIESLAAENPKVFSLLTFALAEQVLPPRNSLPSPPGFKGLQFEGGPQVPPGIKGYGGNPFDKSSFQGTATGAGFGGYNIQTINPY